MSELQFLGPSNETKSVDQNAQQLINMYLVPEETGGKHPAVAYYTPGTTVFSSNSGNQVRGMHENNGVAYAVIDSTFYSINSSGTASSIGSLATSTGRVSIDSTATELMIVDGQDGWIYNISAATLTKISDVDFPSGAATVTQQDGYFIVGDPNTQNFYISALNDGTTWSSLDFETAEFKSDDIVTVKSFRDKLYIFGNQTTEPYFNSGNSSFPFDRINDGILQYGCSAKFSVAGNADSLFWLGEDSGGQSIVIRTANFQPQIISTRALSYQISTYGTISDAFGYIYSMEGEEFYVLTFPTANRTWAFNTKTGLWHQWQSLQNSVKGRHLSNNHIFVYGKNLVGDSQSGNIYYLDMSAYTDNGETITRVLTTAPIHYNNENITIYNLRVDLESGQGLSTGQGSDPQMMLQVSYNGGHTFGNEIWRSCGAQGEYFRRTYWSRLGMSRAPVFRITMTDPIPWIILGAFADIETEERSI